MPEEALEECGPLGQSTPFSADLEVDLLYGVGYEVGQAPVLEIDPDLFHGVEVGGIGREPVDMPAGMRCQVLTHLAVRVRLSRIPQEDQGTPVVAAEVPEAAEDLRAADIRLGGQRQIVTRDEPYL